GKTATTEFAYRDPAPTRNPWNLGHTPGGSSAGSGAAVAARMIPLASGSQTVGSVLRPAAYNGVVGLKPTHGLIPVDGVIPLAWSLDHVGVLARSVEDAALALGVLAGAEYDAAAGRPRPDRRRLHRRQPRAAPLPRRRGADAGRARRAAEPHRADAGAGRTRLDGRRLTVCALELLRDAVDLAAERPRCLRPPVRDPAHQRRGPRAVAP